MKNYTVQSGDTLFGIAAREYGDGDLYPVIARMNNLANPDLIFAGQELLVPYVTYRHLFTAAEDTGAARQQITQHYYGTTDTKIQLIWEVASGVAQETIFPGAWLHIPDLSNVGHHTVQDGDSFAGLAGRWYGDDHLAIVIAHANQMDQDTEPTPGTVLIRPGLNHRKNVSGDTLETLCRDVYGDGILPTWMAVVEAANYIRLPHKLFASQTVNFPS
jgi:nucleoid-associated protein YgaU